MHILVLLPNILKQLKIEDMLFYGIINHCWLDFTALPSGQCKHVVIEHYEGSVLFAELCFFPVWISPWLLLLMLVIQFV